MDLYGLGGDVYFGVYRYFSGPSTFELRAVIITAATAPAVAEVRALSISTAPAATTFFWMTLWRAGTLYAQKRYLSSGKLASETSLGAATMAEVDANTYIARITAHSDTVAYAFGRMNAPAGLAAGTYAIIKTTDGGSTWSSITSGWGNDWAECLTVNTAGTMHVIRIAQSTGLFSAAYQGDTLATMPNPPALTDINHGAMFAALDGALYAGNSTGGLTIEIYQLLPPYTRRTNIASDHPTTVGIARIIKV
jgi:hypothetical protein